MESRFKLYSKKELESMAITDVKNQAHNCRTYLNQNSIPLSLGAIGERHRVQYQLGMVYLVLQEYYKAISKFTAVLRNIEKAPYAHFYRGQAYKALGNNKEAITDYVEQIMIHMRPTHGTWSFSTIRDESHTALNKVPVRGCLNESLKKIKYEDIAEIPKHDLYTAIKTLNFYEKIYWLKVGIRKDTELGKRFWKQEKISECSLSSGTLAKMCKLIERMEKYHQQSQTFYKPTIIGEPIPLIPLNQSPVDLLALRASAIQKEHKEAESSLDEGKFLKMLNQILSNVSYWKAKNNSETDMFQKILARNEGNKITLEMLVKAASDQHTSVVPKLLEPEAIELREAIMNKDYKKLKAVGKKINTYRNTTGLTSFSNPNATVKDTSKADTSQPPPALPPRGSNKK